MNTISETLQAALANHTPQRALLEFATKTFSNENIVVNTGIEMNEIFNADTDLSIGSCPSAEIKFDLLNSDYELDTFEFGTFKAWLGARIDNGTPPTGAKTKTFTEGGVSRLYEFTPLGVFVAERPNIIHKAILNITANDQMVLFDKDMPNATTLGITYPTTVGGIFQKMCLHLNVTAVSNTFLNSDLTVSQEPAEFDGATMRDVLGWIGEVACSTVRFNRAGQIEFAWYNAVNAEYDEHDYTEFNPYWYETEAITKLHVRNSDGTRETVLGSGDNVYLIQNNPFLKV